MTLIQHQELGSSQASITFSSIPQTFTDLFLVISARSNRSGADYSNGKFGFNSSTTGYSARTLIGRTSVITVNGTTDSVLPFGLPAANATANTFSSVQIYIPNYTLAIAKSVSIDGSLENNKAGTDEFENRIDAGLWNDTAAITSIQIGIRALDSASFVQYSSATLYGILKGTSNGVTVV
jgi:hypothetical protein